MAGPPVVPGVQKIFNQPGVVYLIKRYPGYIAMLLAYLRFILRFSFRVGCGVWWCVKWLSCVAE